MYENLIAGMERASSGDVLVLWLKITAATISLVLLLIALVFALTQVRARNRSALVAAFFALANLFTAAYMTADTWVRFDALTGVIDHTLPRIQVALSSVLLAVAAYINLYWAMSAQQRLPWRRMLAVSAMALSAALLVWIEHPALVIASSELEVRDLSVFADYGAFAPWYFGLALVLASEVLVLLMRSPLRRQNPAGWRLNLFSYGVLFAAGAHDAARELGVDLIPFSLLALGFGAFQVGAFAFLATTYARALRAHQEQHHTLQKLTDELSRDPATGLISKPYLQSMLERLDPPEGGLLFIDIDNFKTINDTFGHLAGDAVIHEIAEILRAELGRADVPCRWGGDEFLVYLRNPDEARVQALASHLSRRLAEARLSLPASHRISLSMGFSALDLEGWKACVHRADHALYRSKHSGRNRLTLG